MSTASGLGLLDVSILEACEWAGATPQRPFVKTARVLGTLRDRTGIGPRIAEEPLYDLARPWVVHLRSLDVHGNLGSPIGFGPAGPRYTECRLSPLGAAALAAERGELGPLPIGLVNGDLHAGGPSPPFDPSRVVAAIRAAPSATDAELVSLVGPPSFPTGCHVAIDLDAFGAGAGAELDLAARITPEDSDRLVISHLPPDVSTAEIAESILRRFEVVRHRRERAPIRDVSDESTESGGVRVVVRLLRGAEPDEVDEFLDTVRGLRRTVSVRLDRPLADLVRAAASGDDLEAHLRIVEDAIGR